MEALLDEHRAREKFGLPDDTPQNCRRVTTIDGIDYPLDDEQEAEEDAMDRAADETDWVRLGGRKRP